MDLTTLRSMIQSAVLTYMEDPRTNDVLFLHTFPGSGKTYTTVKTLIDNEFFFVYTSPTHKLGQNEVAKRHDVIQLKSRKHFCNSPELAELEKYGISGGLICSVFCPEKDTCDYYSRIREIFTYPQSWVGVHHHLGNLVQSYIEENGDCNDTIVIDEEFLQSLYVSFTVGLTALEWTVNLLNVLPDSPERTLISHMLKELWWSLKSGRKRDIDYDQIKVDVIEYGDRNNFRNMDLFIDAYENEMIKRYIRGLRLRRNLVKPLFGMAHDFYYNRDRPNYLESMLTLLYNSERNDFRIHFHRYDLDSVQFPNTKIIILDATTPIEIYEKVFNRKIRMVKYGNVDSAKLYQFSGAPTRNRFPMSSLVRFGNGTSDKNFTGGYYRLLSIVNGIVKKHEEEKILIVARRKHKIKERIYEEMIKNKVSAQMVDLRNKWDGESRVAIGHFGGLRGLNDFSDFDVSVVFGAPFPHPGYIKRQSVLLGVPEDQLMEISREMEMVQDLYRIRPVDKPNAHFYVLTSVDIGMKVESRMSPKIMDNWLHGRRNHPICNTEKYTVMRTQVVDVMEKWKALGKSQLRKELRGSNKIKDEVITKMESEGLIEHTALKQGRGRPTKLYTLNWEKLKQDGGTKKQTKDYQLSRMQRLAQ